MAEGASSPELNFSSSPSSPASPPEFAIAPTSMLSSPVRIGPTSQIYPDDGELDEELMIEEENENERPFLPPPSSIPRARETQASQQVYSQFYTPLSPEASPPPSPGAGEIQNEDHIENVHESAPPSAYITSEVEVTYIWGTNINVQDTLTRFSAFLKNYRPQPSPDDITLPEPLYPRMLKNLVQSGSSSFNLDCRALCRYDESLYKMLISYPQELLPLFDMAVIDVVVKELDLNLPDRPPQTRPYGLLSPNPRKLRLLDPNDIDLLLSVRGMATRVSPLMPDLRIAVFRCPTCGYVVEVPIDRGRIIEPSACANCLTNGAVRLDIEIILWQLDSRVNLETVVRLQETPEDIPEGETPITVSLCLYDDLVDSINPGDRLEVTGIYRAQPQQFNKKNRNLKSVYKTYIDVIHIARREKGRFRSEQPDTDEREFRSDENEEEVINEEEMRRRVAELKEIASKPNVYELLTKSFAPSIWEMDDVKKGVLCLLFGGTHKKLLDGQGRFRGEINIILVGDPGTSKSQLLQYVHKIAPRGMYTSGKGSSAVGLTAYVAKDPESGQAVLESGALVLSDRGVCCIDEFDKMGDQTRSILHEVMEQQTVSVAKSGIIATLNARTSILASANPRHSKYNPKLSVVENIDLPPTLLSRFDLIYLVLDNPNEENDRRLAKHLISLYFRNPPEKEDVISTDILTRYISYARENIHPQITDAAGEVLIQGYQGMRQTGRNKKIISATPRQLESLIRLSEAHARIRFSSTVDPEDVHEAIRLVKVAIQQAAIDPQTGTIDMDLIITGRSASGRTRLADLVNQLRTLMTNIATGIRFETLMMDIRRAKGTDIRTEELREALKQLEDDGIIIISGDLRNPVIRPN